MMHWSQRTACPDCGEPLVAIQVIDKGHFDHQDELGYAVGEAPQETFLGIFPLGFDVRGRVKAKMCAACGRIILYGMPFQYRKVD